jgi:thiol-disulfide isomerase/thioredoxin
MTTNPPGSAPSSPKQPPSELITRLRNLVIVFVAVLLSVAIVIGLRTETSSASLEALAAKATPLEVAIANPKPTLIEFYANWCTSCQAMAGDLSDLEDEYGDRVNFVMLNVDNSKWLPEMLRYRVDGIPHFVFMNAAGEALASTIGETPRTIMAANLEALATGGALPHVQNQGQTSKLDSPALTPATKDDPRSHG